jgi:XTP/dITP diphosphohydrolase
MINLVYVTGNKAKIDSAKQLLEPLGINVIQNKVECIEIQADTIEEVAKFSSKYASDILKTNVLKNDCGLIVPALNGFPSAYTHYVEDTLTEDGMLKLMQGVENREAYFL